MSYRYEGMCIFVDDFRLYRAYGFLTIFFCIGVSDVIVFIVFDYHEKRDILVTNGLVFLGYSKVHLKNL